METLKRRRQGAVSILSLNRPARRNALSSALVASLRAALDEIEADPQVRAVVLTGEGETFCAGGDLAEGLGAAEQGFAAGHQGREGFARLLQQLPALRVPVIAAVQGDALGGGCGLMAACDLVIADPEARVGTPEIHLGLFPWMILAALQRDVPRRALLELVLTGERRSAEQALQLGLINRISAPGQALTEALALAEQLAARAPLTVQMGKAAFHRIAEMRYDEALDYMHAQLSLNLLTEDAAEGVAAFLQKREPRWKGR